MARIYLHPTLLARRAAEIARRQAGKIERDACGRPFVLPSADPLAVPATDPPALRWEGLIRAIRALVPARQGRPPSRGEAR